MKPCSTRNQGKIGVNVRKETQSNKFKGIVLTCFGYVFYAH